MKFKEIAVWIAVLGSVAYYGLKEAAQIPKKRDIHQRQFLSSLISDYVDAYGKVELKGKDKKIDSCKTLAFNNGYVKKINNVTLIYVLEEDEEVLYRRGFRTVALNDGTVGVFKIFDRNKDTGIEDEILKLTNQTGVGKQQENYNKLMKSIVQSCLLKYK